MSKENFSKLKKSQSIEIRFAQLLGNVLRVLPNRRRKQNN